MIKAKIVLKTSEEGYIVDHNGEVLGKIQNLEILSQIDSIMLITKVSAEYKRKHATELQEKYSEFNTNFSNYGKLNLNADALLAKSNLTGTQLKILLYLRSKISYKSCIIKKGKRYNMTRKFIAKDLGITMVTVNNAMKKLENEEIIMIKKYAHKREVIYFNPYLVFKGFHVSRETCQMFKKSKWSDTI